MDWVKRNKQDEGPSLEKKMLEALKIQRQEACVYKGTREGGEEKSQGREKRREAESGEGRGREWREEEGTVPIWTLQPPGAFSSV